ncbi:frataxin-like protein [Dioszegia hungarica]|uniref:ferroxidase n=1 Tax=Dioszegia hungarica TaxID=4972 RepID=A0AA38HDJ0_9TREE|nr:frataxin-like protein [Dioszegia hungarica]KAI9638755.1 frataxin-like protein [Dioszegia hungarica]
MSARPSIRAFGSAISKGSSKSTVRSVRPRAISTRGIASLPSRSISRTSLASPFASSASTAGTVRWSSSSTPQSGNEPEPVPSQLSQAEYERISEEDMETLSENLGALCEETGREKWEVDYSSGVLTLSIPPHGTYVLNKQPPNQQIWISSPISGPSRFGYIAPTPVNPSSTGPMSSESDRGAASSGGVGLGGGDEGEIRGAWTHFRKKGVTLGGLVEGELRTLGVGKDVSEGWTGVGIK